MADATTTLSQFQQYVWDRLPPRREVAGREMVDDLVALAIQEWPVDLLSQADPDSTAQVEAMREMVVSMKRQAEFIYGQKRFAGVWFVALQMLIPIIVQVILEWWRHRKVNRSRLTIWRRRWRTDG